MEMCQTAADPASYAEFDRKTSDDFRTIDEELMAYRKAAMDGEEQAVNRELDTDLSVAKSDYARLKQVLETSSADAEKRSQEGFKMQMEASSRQAATRTREAFNKLIERQTADAVLAKNEAGV